MPEGGWSDGRVVRARPTIDGTFHGTYRDGGQPGSGEPAKTAVVGLGLV